MPAGLTERFGANKLIGQLKHGDFDIEILPEKDPVKGGGTVQIAKVVLP